MGGKMGLSPLETLTAIYVGMKLFGILGMLLGPSAFLSSRIWWRSTEKSGRTPKRRMKDENKTAL